MDSIRVLAASFGIMAFSFACFANDNGLSPRELAKIPPEIIIKPSGDLSKGTKPHQGIASVAASADGEHVFVAWYGGSWGENANNYLMMSISSDGGKTFGGVDVVVRSPHCGKVRCFDPALWRDPAGRIHLFWAQSGKVQFDGDGGVWTSVCEDPKNNPFKWSSPRRIAHGVMMNSPTVLKDGTWLYPIGIFYDDRSIRSSPELMPGAHCYASSDGGKTLVWRGGFLPYNNQFPEHKFVELKDGRIWALARRNSNFPIAKIERGELKILHGADAGICQSYSKDGGRTWSKPEISPISAPSTRFCITRLKSGNLLFVTNPTENLSWLEGKSAKKPLMKAYRNKLMAYISKDDGKTWLGGLEIDDRNSVSYPDASQSEDGSIFICYDRARTTEQEIYCAKVTEEDILSSKLVSPNSKLKILVNKGELEFKKPEK